MNRRTFCRLATTAAALAASPLSAAAVVDPPRTLLVNAHALGFRPDVGTGTRYFDTRGDLPHLWETMLRNESLADLLPMHGITTMAEFELLQAEFGRHRVRAVVIDTFQTTSAQLVRWQAPHRA